MFVDLKRSIVDEVGSWQPVIQGDIGSMDEVVNYPGGSYFNFLCVMKTSGLCAIVYRPLPHGR